VIPRDRTFSDLQRQACLVGKAKESPSEWAVKHFQFDEPNNRGPFRLSGNEYVREVLNDFARTDINDEVLVWGSQTKKTGTLMAGLAWTVVNNPRGIMWAMPNENLAAKFSRQRLQAAFKVTAPVRALIPTGAARHSFKTLEMMLGGSIVNLIGTHSAANLSSSPCSLVFGDEIDKFYEGGAKEADAVDLLDQRTKDQTNPQRWKTSTPTTSDGLIWQEYLKGDQRRYFLPCPFCKGEVVLGWSKAFTILPLTGCEAWIGWDPSAKGKDGKWDLEKVSLTAHAVCPHCQRKIGNEHKTGMVRDGKWKPTNPGAAASFVSRHLSSLYSTSTETAWGVLAVKFLQQKASLKGLRGFINGDLAEPYENQDEASARVEIVSGPDAMPLPESVTLLTADHQAVAPYFWVTARTWDKRGNSRLRGCYTCDDWDTLRRIQLALEIEDRHVAIDSRHNPETVRERCLQFGKVVPLGHGSAVHVGWTPWEGQKPAWRQKDKKTGRTEAVGLSEYPVPMARAIGYNLHSLQFAGDFWLSLLQKLRKGPKESGGLLWEIVEFPAGPEVDGALRVDAETYFRHMDAKKYTPRPVGKRVVWEWQLRSSRWPDHILDTEIAQLAWARLHGRLPYHPEDSNGKSRT
jgi:hypothetical protein